MGQRMANQPGEQQTNIVQLRRLPERTLVNELDALTSSSVNDPIAVDGLRLLRSFGLIEDCDMRQSVIQIVEKIAGTKSNL